MASVLHMPRVNFGGWNFRLLWNGKAMIEWNHREDADEDVSIYTPERAAEMLYLMAQEAAAACSVYGYAADDVPLLDELKTYLLYAAALGRCITLLNASTKHSRMAISETTGRKTTAWLTLTPLS